MNANIAGTGAGALLDHRGSLLMIVSVLTIILFALGNLPWELESYDQAKQAFVSWQMVKPAAAISAAGNSDTPSASSDSGPVNDGAAPMTAAGDDGSANRFLYQRTPNRKVATKPPLVGWVSALFYELTRSWQVAWRLPSLSAATLIAYLLWRRGAIFGSLGGLIALSAFSLNLFTPRLATLVRTDMPLALAAFLIALLFFDQVRARAEWPTRERCLLFLLLTASMLMKGPIIYAFVLPAIVLFAWRYRGETILRSIATGWWPWLFSLGIFIVWVVGGVETMPRFYNKVVLREFVGRFSETFHRPQPILFYLPHLLHKWAPWSLLLIALLWIKYRAGRLPPRMAAATTAGPPRKERGFADWSPECFWLLAWGAGGLIVMSCIPSKRVDRIFPVLPPLCLLLGVMIGERLTHRPDTEGRSQTVARWCTIAIWFAAIFSSGDVAARIVSGFRQRRDALVKCGSEFRKQAKDERLRYAVLKTSTEALVFYLDVPGFTNESEALRLWKAGQLDALIGSEKRIESLLPELNESAISRTDFCRKVKGQKRYVVVQRRVLP